MDIREQALQDAMESGASEEDIALIVRWLKPRYSEYDGPVGIGRVLKRLYKEAKDDA